MSNIYLLTGERRTGKTTAVKAVVDAIGPDRCGGFITEEIREDGHRVGFRLVNLDGGSRVIAGIQVDSPYRVEIYGVDINGLESAASEALESAIRTKDLIVVDEIGPMQLFSLQFRQQVSKALEDARIFLGTVVLRPHPWADQLKRRDDIHLVELTTDNRETVTERLIESIIYELKS
jgi:nucleoside-triphosphatase